jgi:putative transcriptional regulator
MDVIGEFPKKGSILVSAPFLYDVFKRSVILIAEDNEEGSVGFIINKPLNFKLHEIVKDFPETNSKLYIGGPVQTDSIHYIHKAGNLLDESIEVADGIYWGGNFEALKVLVKNGQINDDDIKYFIGYAGWGQNQLKEEFIEETWYMTKAKAVDIFNENSDKLWNDLLIDTGNKYAVFANFSDDPSLN